MARFPVPLASGALQGSLELQEKELARRLAGLEELVRGFEDFERPAYEAWIRVELGPSLLALEELHQRIYERRLRAQKILSRLQGGRAEKEPDPEIQARRQAKLDAKRASRREEKRQRKQDARQGAGSGAGPGAGEDTSRRQGLVSLYRALARKLHPDSPTLVRGLARERVLALWMESQAAYESGNMERLLAILAWLGETGAEPKPLSYAERLRRVRAMERSCERLLKEIAELRAHPAWQFTRAGGKARRRLRGQAARELEDELGRTQEVLEKLEQFLKTARKVSRR